MENQIPYSQILGGFAEPVVFVDAQHFIRYMNPSARKHYARWGDVIGKSIFEYHAANSCRMIKKVFDQLQNGHKEVLISSNEKRCVYMRGVYDENNSLIGYYERYERINRGL
jgi:DUF438 domain-containing protein